MPWGTLACVPLISCKHADYVEGRTCVWERMTSSKPLKRLLPGLLVPWQKNLHLQQAMALPRLLPLRLRHTAEAAVAEEQDEREQQRQQAMAYLDQLQRLAG